MAANPIDLTTVAAVSSYLSLVTPGPADQIVQLLVTGASQYFLSRTGLASLNSVGSFSDWYDGNGNQRLFLRNRPIVSVVAVRVSGRSIPLSTAYGQGGYLIHGDGKSLVIRSGGTTGVSWFSSCPRFDLGVQNVFVQYTAGYAAVPFDVADKCAQLVAVNFKRRSWIDQTSQMIQQGGTMTYRDWEVPPEVERVIQIYTPTAIV